MPYPEKNILKNFSKIILNFQNNYNIISAQKNFDPYFESHPSK
jgi:hypothetical protein